MSNKLLQEINQTTTGKNHMLIEFKTKNYKCFKDEAVLSMVAANITELEENKFTPPSCQAFNGNLLKTATVFGANASGKSNLFDAIWFMKTFTLESSTRYQANQKIPVVPFKLDEDSEKEPSLFEIKFIQNGTIYRYGFEVNSEKVISEWLYYVPKEKETYIFKRNPDKSLQVNGSSRFKTMSKIKNTFQDLLRDNALFLSIAAQFNEQNAVDILNCFIRVMFMKGYNTLFLTLFRQSNQHESPRMA